MILLQAVDPDTARADVREILDDRRFRSDPAPRPFRGPLQWLGDRLTAIGRWLGDALNVLPWFIWLAAGTIAFVLLIAWAVRRGRRSRGGSPAPAYRAGRIREDPAALEHAADLAEQRGDLEGAVRLRFRAGLLRLGDRRAIEYQPSLTTSEVRALLGSETFDALAGAFEEIAYGRRPARPPDVAAARTDWPKVVAQGRRE